MRASWISFRSGFSRPLGLLWVTLAILSPTTDLPAQAAAAELSTEPVITDVGPHHRRWTRQHVQQLPNGRTRTNVTSYVELQSGLHVLGADGRWRESDPSFAILPDGSGAVAHHSLHTVAIAANLNTRGAITVQTADGKSLVCNVIGIAWHDAATGRSQMFAQVQDSIGELHGTDTVLFRDAFHGVAADVRYQNRRDGFEQDLVLLEAVAPPPEFNRETTRLEVWTEFLESPSANVTQRARAGMTDDTVDWGAMQTGPGRAFLLGEDRRTAGAHVAKRWVTTADQRTFLVEAVRYPAAKRDLDRLPARQAAVNPPAGGAAGAVNALVKVDGFAGERPFPAAPKPRPANSTDRFRTAAATSPLQRETAGATAAVSTPSPLGGERAGVRGLSTSGRAGYVIDYDLQNSLTNFTLQCDTTYYVAGAVNLYAVTTIEGGVVVKVAPTNTAQLNFITAPIWATGPYRPAIFTARDDDSIGTPIAGSTGSPSGWYGGAYLNLSANATGAHFRVSHARTAVRFNDVSLTLRHAQFVHCSNVVEKTGDWLTAPLTIENALAYDSQVFLRGQCFLTASHLTVHQSGLLVAAEETGSATLNNSILADVEEQGGTFLTLNSSYNGSAAGLFQTVGAAAHYLANASPHRNAGNANLNSTLLNNERKLRTTYPPVVLTGALAMSSVLTPQAQRDTDAPDRGFLYEPLDFVFGQASLTNATVSMAPGTAVGFYGTNNTPGLLLRQGASLQSTGTPAQLNRLVRYNCVQEQANGNWVGFGPSLATATNGATTPAISVATRFTEWVMPGRNDVYHFQGSVTVAGALVCRDDQFHGGYLYTERPELFATNNLFHRVQLGMEDWWGDSDFHVRLANNTLRGGILAWVHFGTNLWAFTNNLFDAVDTVYAASDPVSADFNGYVTNAVCQLLLSPGASNVMLAASPAYQTGALGRFYLPTNGPATNLFNAGSTNAHLLGLWHFTTATNNVKETNSVVDIGFHYVAVGSNGQPVDTDEDGLPDWLEDADGDGTFGSGETGWLTQTDSDGDEVDDGIETLLGRNPRVAGTTNDAAGVLNLRRYTPLK